MSLADCIKHFPPRHGDRISCPDLLMDVNLNKIDLDENAAPSISRVLTLGQENCGGLDERQHSEA